jgi:hypothetical protein
MRIRACRSSAAAAPERPSAARTRKRDREIHDALARGVIVTAISRTLRLDPANGPQLPHRPDPSRVDPRCPGCRHGLLDPHPPYLYRRWADAVRSTQRLHQELRPRRLHREPVYLLLSPPCWQDTTISHTTASARRQEGRQMDPQPAERPDADHRTLRRTSGHPGPCLRVRRDVDHASRLITMFPGERARKNSPATVELIFTSICGR